jgi:hypothetical protein
MLMPLKLSFILGLDDGFHTHEALRDVGWCGAGCQRQILQTSHRHTVNLHLTPRGPEDAARASNRDIIVARFVQDGSVRRVQVVDDQPTTFEITQDSMRIFYQAQLV